MAAPDARSVVEVKARELLRALADLSVRVGALRVAEAGEGLACLIQVWPAAELMPVSRGSCRPASAQPGCERLSRFKHREGLERPPERRLRRNAQPALQHGRVDPPEIH